MIETKLNLLPAFVNNYCYGDLSKVIITKQTSSGNYTTVGRDAIGSTKQYCYVATGKDVMSTFGLRVGDIINVQNTLITPSGNYNVYDATDQLATGVPCLLVTSSNISGIVNNWDSTYAQLNNKPVYRQEYHGSLFRDILVITDFVNNPSTTIVKSLLGGDFQVDNDNYIKYPSMVGRTGETVVYVMRGTQAQSQHIEEDCFLQGADIVSIDYIGNYFTNLNLSKLLFTNLKEINLSNNFLTLGNIYTDIHINEGSNVFYGNNNPIKFEPSSFAGSNLKKMILPTSDHYSYAIPAGAFAGCTQLEEVYIPDGCVTSIGANAFKGCSNLKYVYIGSAVTTIGDGAFAGCYNVERYETSNLNTKFVGTTGALLQKHESDLNPATNGHEWSLLFATSYFINGAYDFVHTGSMFQANAYNYIRIDATSVQIPILRNMFVYNENYRQEYANGEYNVYDVYGNVYENAYLITDNNKNMVQGDYTNQNITHILVPVTYYIGDISNGACAGDTNITYVNFDGQAGFWGNGVYFYNLRKIGNNAFKNCTNIYDIYLNNESSKSHWEECFIGNSAFEGCTHITSLSTVGTNPRHYTFSDRAFFGCTSLSSIAFGNPLSEGQLGTLCFGNTPNLASITNQNGSNKYFCDCNCIVMTTQVPGTGNYKYSVVVGCKNSYLAQLRYIYNTGNITVDEIGDYAFYGCSNLTLDGSVPSGYASDSGRIDGYTKVGNSAFYGCSSLGSTVNEGMFGLYDLQEIGEKAFYGCTSLGYLTLPSAQTIGSKAFGNSGVFSVELSQNNVVSIEDDAFDGCDIQSFYVYSNSENMSKALRNSDINVENAFLKRLDTSGSTSLIKSGDGKDIVNTIYGNPNKNITVIKSSAFSGVNLNNSTNTSGNIYIPASAHLIGSNVLAKSKINNSITGDPTSPFNLVLSGMTFSTANMLRNDGASNGLLYYVGAKYFKKIVAETFNHTYRKYELRLNSQNHVLTVQENLNDGQTITPIAHIGYNSHSGNLVINIMAKLLPGYIDDVNSTAVELFTTPIEIILMRFNQKFSLNEIAVYCDSALAPGTTWLGYSIPNDVAYVTSYAYTPYNTNTIEPFANCGWVINVISERLLSTSTGTFKGCTNLEHYVVNGYSDNSNYSTFDGILPESTFEGCTSFISMTSGNNKFLPYIVKYKKNCLKGCTSYVGSSDLMTATHIEEGAFANTGLTSVDLCSAISIDPKAFIGCDLTYANANTINGYYTTSVDNSSIIDLSNIMIALGGSQCSAFGAYRGVGPYAFYGSSFDGHLNNVSNGYIVGESAFSESHIRTVSGTMVIGENAFKNCLNLSGVTLNGGSTLSQSSFEGCTNLSSLTIHASIAIPKKAFAKCTSLTTISTTSTIGESAFEGCTGLTSMTSTNAIGKNAFNGCTNLATINLNNYCFFDETAFIGCRIASINTTDNRYYDNTGHCLLQEDEDGKYMVVLGDRYFDLSTNANRPIQTIGKHAFNGRGLVGEIIIPGTVTRIDDYAFANNPDLTYVSIPSTVEYIGDHAFDGCGLLSFTLPDSCTDLGEAVFKGCPLTNGFNCNTFDKRYYDDTYTPQSASTLATAVSSSDGFFKSTLDLTHTNFNSIKHNAFEGTEIKVVKLPILCEYIEEECFKDCISLTELHIYGTEDIRIEFDNSAFYGCNHLHDIYLHTEAIPTTNSSNEFFGCGSNLDAKYLHIPSALEENPDFISSDFYLQLVTDGRYIIVTDMDE